MTRSNRIVGALALVFGLVCPGLAHRTAWAEPCVRSSQEGDAPDLSGRNLIPTFFDAWVARYPTSTLPARMAVQTGIECSVCHSGDGFGFPGNCYREDLRALILQGLSIEAALDQLDAEDSDGDGVPNGVEATMPRHDGPDIGYNMGLVGDLGVDPCATDPSQPVTGVAETPPPPIPTASVTGLALMSLLLLSIGVGVIRRRAASQ